MGDPQSALAVTAPALLVGNAHRALMFRNQLRRRLSGPLVLGALPGALLGGLFAVAIPAAVLHWLMLAMATLAVLRAVGWLRFTVPARSLGLVGFGAGGLCATSGGAGFLVAPALLSAGLKGERFVATAATGAVAMHLGRMIGYGAGGLITTSTLANATLLAVAITAGNTAGKRVRALLDGRLDGRLEYAALCLCLGLAIAGVA